MGGGGSKSRNSVDVVNEAIVSVVLETANNCGARVTQTQEVVYGGLTVGSRIRQSATVNMACLQNVEVNTDLIYQIATRIQQEAEASRVTLVDPLTRTRAVNEQNLRNYLSTSITTKALQNCAVTADQTQRAIFGGVSIGAVQEQTLEIYVKCLTETLNKSRVAMGIVADSSQSAQASDATGFTIGGLGVLWWFILLLVIILVSAAAYAAYRFLPSSFLFSDEEGGEREDQKRKEPASAPVFIPFQA
jgi:hypothetical protein